MAVSQLKPKPESLLLTIRAAAQDSRKVAFGRHARERMEERGFTDLDALRVLKEGDISGTIDPGQSPGEWKCKVIARMKGSRDAGVVTVVLSSGRLFVKTMEWEDL